MFLKFALAIVLLYYRLLQRTLRFSVTGFSEVEKELEEGRNPVFASAHTALLPCILSYRGPAVMLVSRSRDGELIATALEKSGFEVVRGSSSRGAIAALAQLFEATRQAKPIAIAFDGPKGPPLIPKFGVAACAEKATGSLYFVSARPLPSLFFKTGLCIWLNSWDKFLLPLPFCRFEVCYEKIEVDVGKSDSQWKQKTLQKLESRAREVYGAQYEQ